MKLADVTARTLPSKAWATLFWNSLYYAVRSRIPRTDERDREMRRARTIVWAAGRMPTHSQHLTLGFLVDTLIPLLGGGDEEEIALLEADPEKFYAEAVEWAKARKEAIAKRERQLAANEARVERLAADAETGGEAPAVPAG